ncbi:uncharacterized protein Z520_02558 [Fonsecaea multimorphosa CBS 102226]|uniref:Uncharacterized protein n=1 Tax=Fonsecaea multimorphosa CBS 102226 TaxID=1442371 RepID=A0A0D2L0C8_9EURO|nr:uncharacterized protein Z520_02558 [Fonsecaea multimorphosa CBS 102226]KIY02419.1 hypothetical protein Z520_02558 [Fonsecaea multimorphosa CBS 102226]
MATFDFARMRPDQYNLYDAASAVDFQNMVEDLMNVVRTNAAAFEERDAELSTFLRLLLESEDAWQLAAQVVPEFRYPQDRDLGEEDTLLNHILRAVEDKRPRAPYNDPKVAAEKAVMRLMFRNLVEYIETHGKGVTRATPQELEEIEDMGHAQ